MQTIFWCPTGPLMSWDGEALQIADLNPEIKTQWRMTRWERFRTGWRLMLTAIR